MDEPAFVLTRHKLSVHHFMRMVETGILEERERVELIEGELVDMAPIGEDHQASVMNLTRRLVFAFGEQAFVSVQGSVRLDDFSQPQPDFAILRPREDEYWGHYPSPPDVLLLIEVADSSLRFDTNVKRPLYARAGIAEYWIVNLRHHKVTVYREPSGNDYGWSKDFGPGGRVGLALAPEIEIVLDRVLR